VIGNDLEIEIIELYRKDITRLLSINQIAKELKKTYPYIHKKMTSFLKEGIFSQTKIGNSLLCSINLDNEDAIILLSINESLNKKKTLEKNKNLELLSKKLLENTNEEFMQQFQTIIYSKDRILFVIQDSQRKEALKEELKKKLNKDFGKELKTEPKKLLKSKKDKSNNSKKAYNPDNPNINFLTRKEFQKEIIKEYSIIKNHTLLYQKEKYYEIINEIKQELRMKNSPLLN
jgi:hypothetical protein